MTESILNKPETPSQLLRLLGALSNPIRLRMLALLQSKPMHIYALAKELNISYPLAHLYLASLESLGLVDGEIKEGIADRRERKEYHVVPFELVLSPREIFKLYEKKGERRVG